MPTFVEKNKFLNAQNLAQLAKDTSFIAVMAVGMSVVIIAGGIDQNYTWIIIGGGVVAAVVLDNFNTCLARRRLARAADGSAH